MENTNISNHIYKKNTIYSYNEAFITVIDKNHEVYVINILYLKIQKYNLNIPELYFYFQLLQIYSINQFNQLISYHSRTSVYKYTR